MKTFTIREIKRAFSRSRGHWEDLKGELELIFIRRNKRKGTSRTRRKK